MRPVIGVPGSFWRCARCWIILRIVLRMPRSPVIVFDSAVGPDFLQQLVQNWVVLRYALRRQRIPIIGVFEGLDFFQLFVECWVVLGFVLRRRRSPVIVVFGSVGPDFLQQFVDVRHTILTIHWWL
jgi:hypothetical protein